MNLRVAQIDDIPAMLAIYAYYVKNTDISFEYTAPTPEEFTTRFRRITGQFPWLVCEDGDCILGYAYADLAFSREAYAWDTDFAIYIHRDCHRSGAGRALYSALERLVSLQGYHNIYALITGSNTVSCIFHERLGYRLLGTLTQTGFKSGCWMDVCWYGKRISDPFAPAAKPVPFPLLTKDIIDGCLTPDL